MLQIATWIRECDEPDFERLFAPHADVAVRNARRNIVGDSEADGLLLTGGPDIGAAFHVQPPADPSSIREPDPARDAWEIAAARRALERGAPVFAICKGMQLLNVALGGTLHLDISVHNLPEQRLRNIQRLRHDSSAVHRFPSVNSSHHQAIDRLAEGLHIEAWCAEDDIIEQMRLREHPFCLGVQYHPERDSVYRALFDDFISAVRTNARERKGIAAGT